MTTSEWIQTISIIASAVATVVIAFFAWLQWKVAARIAALNESLASETKRYAEVSEAQLHLLRQQWEKDAKAWLFFDVEAKGESFLLRCENAGKPTVYVSYARLFSLESQMPGFSVLHQIGKPLRAGERYDFDLAPEMTDSIKKSVFMGRFYSAADVRALESGAQCKMVIEFYDDGITRIVERHFPLQYVHGVWHAGLPKPQF